MSGHAETEHVAAAHPDLPPPMGPDEPSVNGQVPTVSGSTSWSPVNLGAVLDALASGDDLGEQPTMLARTDGQHLLYPGRVHALYGETESGKTWVALHACAERLKAGDTVLYLDFEDTAAAITARLLAVGAHPDAIRERFLYVSPSQRLRDLAERDLGEALTRRPALSVLDGVTESLALEGLSINDNSDVAAWHDRIPRRIAREGAAALLLDHVTKDRETRGRWAIGAQHKLAGIDGAAYTVRVIRPFARGQDGLLALEISKDRPGAIRGACPGRKAAQITVRSYAGGTGVALDLEPSAAADTGTFRPTTLMERISRALEAGTHLSKNGIREAVKGDNNAKNLALELLIGEGYVTVEHGRNRSQMHRAVRAFRSDQPTPSHDHDDHLEDKLL